MVTRFDCGLSWGKFVALVVWVWSVASVFLAIVTYGQSYVERLIDASAFFGVIASATVLVVVGAAFLDRLFDSPEVPAVSEQAQSLLARLHQARANERYRTAAETVYWLSQYKQLAIDAVAALEDSGKGVSLRLIPDRRSADR